MVSEKQDHVDVCIIGAGPAGSTLAARLAQLGHRVALVERCVFPRPHLGESLSPGVLPLLDITGARDSVERAGFGRVSIVNVNWDDGPTERRDPGESGLLVDRGRFDELLLDRARALGVRVHQPAVATARTHDGSGWTLRVEGAGDIGWLRAAFLAEAGGRSSTRRTRRRWTGCRTLALHAYWRGSTLPRAPRIEAGTDAWYWGVPLPDGTYNTLVFVDVDQFRARASSPIAGRFEELIGRSGLMAGCRDARMVSSVSAIDATSYIDEDCVSPCSIKIGEAALALDPLSSSGVQKAMQSALSGAVVVNTLLRKPESADAAERFYRDSLAEASLRHQRWASGYYATAAANKDDEFWQKRAAGAEPDAERRVVVDTGVTAGAEARVELSPQVSFRDQACIDGEFVVVKPVVCHPNLPQPIGYLGGWELAPLLRELPRGLTKTEIGRHWSSCVPLETGLNIAEWLIGHGVLVLKVDRTVSDLMC